MVQRVIIVVLVLAFAAGSVVYMYGAGGPAPVPVSTHASSSDPGVQFDLKRRNPHTQGAALKIDLDNIPDVVAEIDGKPINKDLYVRALKGLQRSLDQMGGGVTQEMLDSVKQNILNNLINTNLLAKQAEVENIALDDAKAGERLAQLKANFQDQKAFEQTLKTQGITEEKLKKEIGKSLQIQTLLEKKVTSAVEVTDAELRDYYDLNQLKFEEEEKVRASHILARADKSASGDEKKKARERIENILQQIKDGADFSELARTQSDDKAAAERGGEIGVITRRQVVPEFSKAAFAMEPGEVSDIVETPFGYHIIKVQERIPPRVIPFEEAKKNIRTTLTRERIDQKIKEYIDGLRGKANVKILI